MSGPAPSPSPAAAPGICSHQDAIIRHAVDLLCTETASEEQRLLLADALDELAAEQALDPRHAHRAPNSRGMARQLRHAVYLPQEN